MDDAEILDRIHQIVDTERELRAHLAEDPDDAAETRGRMRKLEESLDQCWDLLRQRRARKEFGEDPADAEARPVPEVESYLQ
jgi:hypothetical protein